MNLRVRRVTGESLSAMVKVDCRAVDGRRVVERETVEDGGDAVD